LPFGIDTAPLTPFQDKAERKNLQVGYIGTIFEHKGVDLLVKAFLKLPEDARARLKVYGDTNQFPDYARSVIALAETNHVARSKIDFAGTFPNERLGEVLQDLDVLIVPSRWYENTPLVIQSALATKTPVIATDLGGMSELVRHRVNGLLFNLNDADGLAEQIRMLVEDRKLLKTLRENIPAERTISEMVDDIQAVYKDVSGRAKKSELECSAAGL